MVRPKPRRIKHPKPEDMKGCQKPTPALKKILSKHPPSEKLVLVLRIFQYCWEYRINPQKWVMERLYLYLYKKAWQEHRKIINTSKSGKNKYYWGDQESSDLTLRCREEKPENRRAALMQFIYWCDHDQSQQPPEAVMDCLLPYLYILAQQEHRKMVDNRDSDDERFDRYYWEVFDRVYRVKILWRNINIVAERWGKDYSKYKKWFFKKKGITYAIGFVGGKALEEYAQKRGINLKDPYANDLVTFEKISDYGDSFRTGCYEWLHKNNLYDLLQDPSDVKKPFDLI